MFKTFIIEYWLEVLFGAMTAAMGAWCKSLQKKLKQKQKEEEEKKKAEEEKKKAEEAKEKARDEALKAILHDLLFQHCNKYLALGYVPVNESEKVLARGDVLWEAYSGIGGNSTGEDIYNEFKDLPIRNSNTA